MKPGTDKGTDVMAGTEGKGRGLAKAPGPAKPLSNGQAIFVLTYVANGGNASAAYRAGHPGVTPATAWVNGHKTLRNTKVAAAIGKVQAERVQRLTMQADEAAMLVSIAARADVRQMLDADGRPLPMHLWPDEFAKAVKARKADGTIVLHDGLKARELILSMAGKLRQVHDVNVFDHLGYLAAKNHQHKEATHGKEEDDGNA